MAAVVRVKRRLEDEPLDALILNCKRQKIDAASKEEDAELSALLKFAGTTSSQEDDILTHIRKPTKDELEQQFKKPNVNVNEKIRQQTRQDSKNSRFKVVSCFRSENDKAVEDSSIAGLTVYDVEAPTVNLPSDEEIKYVYDLYYTSSDDLGDVSEENISIFAYDDALVPGSMRDNGMTRYESGEESDDSNAENFWRNDYPDESDMESINEDDMIDAIKKLDLADDTLSSDAEEEGFIYNIDNEGDMDESEGERYGERYERFKAKHQSGVETTGLEPNLYCGDIDEEEYYY